MGKGVLHPRVFGPPNSITETWFYRAALRIPQPNLPGASGRSTPMNIPFQTAAAGELIVETDANGQKHWFLNLLNRPLDQ